MTWFRGRGTRLKGLTSTLNKHPTSPCFICKVLARTHWSKSRWASLMIGSKSCRIKITICLIWCSSFLKRRISMKINLRTKLRLKLQLWRGKTQSSSLKNLMLKKSSWNHYSKNLSSTSLLTPNLLMIILLKMNFLQRKNNKNKRGRSLQLHKNPNKNHWENRLRGNL